MSWLTALKSVFHAVGVGVAAAQPFEGLIGAIPVAGLPAVTMINAIAAVEGLLPQSGAGAAKKAAVTAITVAAHPSLPAADISTAIDQMVAGLNALSAAMAKLPAS